MSDAAQERAEHEGTKRCRGENILPCDKQAGEMLLTTFKQIDAIFGAEKKFDIPDIPA